MTQIKNLLKDKKIPKPRQESFEGLPIRELRKKTRLWIDNEYFERGYAGTFRNKKVLDVYCVLAKYANSKKQNCFPAISTIMKEAGIKNRNTVMNAIKLLEAFGFIYIARSRGWRPNNYFLLRDSNWKTANSISIDTVLPSKKRGKLVSNNAGEQYQKQPENSIASDTRSHISKSDKEIKEADNKKINTETEENDGKATTKRWLIMLTPYYEETDILNACTELQRTSDDVSFTALKSLLNCWSKEGKIKVKKIMTW